MTLCHVLFLSEGTHILFKDSNTGWHIRNGEFILDTATIPRTDRFSYTREGSPWYAWEWFSDILIGGVHRNSGLPGVAFLAALSISIAVWGASRLSLSLGGNFFLTGAAAALVLGTTSIHWLARPHIFSWILALLFLAAAEHARLGSDRHLNWLVPAACLWANMHGSFALGPGILLLYAMGEWLSGRANRTKGNRFAVIAAGSFLATFINPYGWRLHQHVISYLSDTYLMDHTAEFRSFSFHSPGAYYVELFLATAFLGTVAQLRQRAFGPVLLSGAMLHISLHSARHLATAAILLLPLSIAALTREARRMPGLGAVLDYSDRLREFERRVRGVVPVVLVMVLAAAVLGEMARDGKVGFSQTRFPIKAVDFLEQQDPNARVFTKDQWGGYLIYRFAGHRQVFIDGRGDFYGKEMLETYARVAELKSGWDAALRQYGVRYVLAAPDAALASALRLSAGWKSVYSDSVGEVFQKVV